MSLAHLARKRYGVLGFLSLCFVALVWQYHPSSLRGSYKEWRTSLAPPDPFTTNATLGFGAIIALSSEDVNDEHAWRQKGMIAAANRTGLVVDIFSPRDPTAKELHDLQNTAGDIHPKDGPGLAWLAHLQLLEKIVAASALSTILILEDDADWDINIKLQLAPSARIPSAFRNITNSTEDPKLAPFGTDWDVLWLGHCGFNFKKATKKIMVQDDTVLDPARHRAVLGQGLYRANPPHSRLIATPVAPMCTFAYAVTLEGAKKLLERPQHGGKGMDYSTSVACGTGALRCVAPMPEIFHHHKRVGGGYAPQIVREGTEEEKKERPRRFTQNIAWSARCSAEGGKDGRKQCLPDKDDWIKYSN